MLGAKERALLLALSETEYCTSGTLAKALGVSSKTAQGMGKGSARKAAEKWCGHSGAHPPWLSSAGE